MLTATEHKALRAKIDKFAAWVDSIRGRNGWASYKPEDIPDSVKPFKTTNDERSAVEVYEFVHDKPDKYFLYISQEKQEATTWTGDKLGSVLFGREYRDNFGGRRVPVTIHAINGLTYHGTYYKSSGDFARVKRAKH